MTSLVIRLESCRVECGIRLWVLVTAAGMSDTPESLLDVDKIKELSLLVARCGVNDSRGLVNPLFELVGVTIHMQTNSN